MVKTNKKSLIAMIAMVVLLIASIAMGITGAWFTATDDADGGPLTFGTIVVSVDGYAVNYKSGTVVMPGDTLSVEGTIKNEGAAAHVAYKITYTVTKEEADITDDVLESSEQTVYGYQAVDAAGSIDLSDLTVAVPDSTGNGAQGASLTAKIEVYAVQQANYTLTASASDLAAVYAEISALHA